MKQWNKVVAAILICATVMLTGCADAMPDLTEEENAIIAEYAAGILLKYDKNYTEALPIMEETVEEVVVEENVTEEPETVSENIVEQESVALTEDTTETIVTDIGLFLGLQGINIKYTGCELAASYTEGENIAFSLDATPGNQLLIAKFDMTNTDSVDQNVDILNQGAKFRLILNGGERKTALYTMLLNDLSIYKGTVLAGATQQVVLICEIPADAAAPETLSLYINNGTETATIVLQ